MLSDNYFVIKNNKKISKKRFSILKRQKRKSLVGLKKGGLFINSGDIVSVLFWKKYDMYQFEGILLGLKKRINNLESVLIIRNIILGVGIEYTISYYTNRLFSLKVLDYKRKRFIYKRSKLYYIRNKKNRASRVK